MRSPEAAAAAALVAAGLEVHEVGAAGLVVEVGGRRAEVGLGSLRRVLALAPPEDHPARVATWVAAVSAALAGQPLAGEPRDHLVPRLLAQADPRLWTRALAPGLHLALALDQPLHQRLLSPFDLPALGLSMADAQAVALANLRAATPAPALDRGVYTWTVGDGLDAARLLLAGSWLSDASGALVVVPARDLCRWVPLRRAADLEAGVALALDARTLGDLPYPLSPTLWWVPAGAGEVAPVTVRVEGGTVSLGLPEDLLRRV